MMINLEAPRTAQARTSNSITLSSLLKKDAVAAHLGFSVRTLESLVATNEFPAGVRLGRCLFWAEETVEAWQQRLFAAQIKWRP